MYSFLLSEEKKMDNVMSEILTQKERVSLEEKNKIPKQFIIPLFKKLFALYPYASNELHAIRDRRLMFYHKLAGRLGKAYGKAFSTPHNNDYIDECLNNIDQRLQQAQKGYEEIKDDLEPSRFTLYFRRP